MSKKRFLKVKILLVMLCAFNIAHAQLKTVTGTVKDESGKPLENATISATGAQSVKSGTDGTFTIAVPTVTTKLVVSNTEYKEQTIDITNTNTVDVKLKRDVTELGDVVVNIGYGTQKAKDVTGSISSVKGDQIKDLPVTNVADALQGRIAGVDVTQSTGEAGSNTSQITVRGVSSLFQAQPLYVIDGVIQHANPVGDGPAPGSNINPKDIASIDVLKDASATAIYGAAAAGGVIIITTKKGQGKPTINFSSRYGVTTPEVLQLLDTAGYFRLDSYTNKYWVGDTQKDTFPNTNWVNALFRNGVEQNYSLSFAGSTPVVNYYMSGTYNNTQGVYINNSSDLYSFTLNSDLKVSDHLKIGEQIDAYQRSTSPVDYAIDPSNSVASPRVNPPFVTLPIVSVYGPTPGSFGSNVSHFNGVNPVAQILSKTRNITQANVQGNVYAEVKFLRSFTFKATLGYTIFNEQGNSYNGPYAAGSEVISTSVLFKDFVSYKNLLNAYVLAFDKSYGKNNINALVGYEQYQGLYNGLFTSETNVIASGYTYFPTSSTIDNINSGYDPYPLVESQFGRINYNYNSKYYASVSIRRDADYIHFGPGNQAGIFPAASAGWKISDEPFFKPLLSKLNFLKLRASYGSVGNSNIPAYKFLSGYSPENSDQAGYSTSNAASFGTSSSNPVLTYTLTNLANKDIKWETTREFNVGFDGEALGGKLFYTIEWYRKSTINLLYSLPIPISSGFSSYFANIGTSQNTGADILIGYKDHIKDVNYSVSFTGSFNNNLVVSLGGNGQNPLFDGNNNYPPYGGQMANAGGLTYTAAGQPFGQFWGYRVLGIYQTDAEASTGPTVNGVSPKAGDLKYFDKNGDGVMSALDDTIIGNPYPKFTYGLTMNVSWKGFDLAMLLHGVAGVDIFNGVTPYSEALFTYGNTSEKVFGASLLGNNGVTNQPRIGRTNGSGGFVNDPYGNFTNPSSYFVENGSYLKIQNLQIGYKLPAKLLQKANIKSARIFIMGNNLVTFTKYSGIDPELGSQNTGVNGGTTNRGIDGPYKYPSIKTYSAGIDIGL